MKEEIIIKKATSIKGGDIQLFHNSIKSADHMITCLPQIIHIIKKKNLAFKTLT